MFKLRKNWRKVIESNPVRACTVDNVLEAIKTLNVTEKSFKFDGRFDDDMDLEITQPETCLYLPFNAIKYIEEGG